MRNPQAEIAGKLRPELHTRTRRLPCMNAETVFLQRARKSRRKQVHTYPTTHQEVAEVERGTQIFFGGLDSKPPNLFG